MNKKLILIIPVVMVIGILLATITILSEVGEKDLEEIKTEEQLIIDPPAPGAIANYEIVFHTNWSEQTHPNAYPGGAHFSPLVVVTHEDNQGIFKENTIATEGIKVMAETGGTRPLINEVKQLQQENKVIDYGTGNLIFLSSTRETKPVTVKASIDQYNRISIVSMIAPSPDWFVGIRNVELIQNGEWVESLEIDAITYDAGTDSGEDFNSGNAKTNPKENIHVITTGPLGNTDSLGHFEIRRVSVS